MECLTTDLKSYIGSFLDTRNLVSLSETCTRYCSEIRKEKWPHLIVRVESSVMLSKCMEKFSFISFNLRDTDVTDVSNLGNCHTLDLRFTKVTDVSNLDKCHTLNLSGTKVTDVSVNELREKGVIVIT